MADHIRLSEQMDSLLLGILLGFIAGYAVRALISRVRRRRFEEDYGFNPRSRLRHRSWRGHGNTRDGLSIRPGWS